MMAKLIVDDSQPRDVRVVYTWWHVAILGALTGLVYWLLALGISHFVLDPIYCSANVNATVCNNSLLVAGNIAGILVAAVALGGLVRLNVYRPIVIVVATAIVLWGFAGWISALGWGEAVTWSVVAFSLCFTTFSWICRYSRTALVIPVVAAVVVIARVFPLL